MALQAYSSTLENPNNILANLVASFCQMLAEISLVREHQENSTSLQFPLYRRLSQFPAWALLTAVSQRNLAPEAVSAIGAELALSLAMPKPFRKSFAVHLLNWLNGPAASTKGNSTAIWQKKALRIRQDANYLFAVKDASPGQDGLDSTAEVFAHRIAKYFRAQVEFARDKDHQGVQDYRSQTPSEMRASGHHLQGKISEGNESAMQESLAMYAGIPADWVLDMPLAGPHLCEWSMVLDVHDGSVKTALELFAQGRAPRPPMAGDSLEEAGDIIVKPLPRFLAEQLLRKLEAHPGATTVCMLLPQAQATSRDSTLSIPAKNLPGLRPSVARLTNGFGKLAISLGVPPIVAALLANDPRLVPTGKFFYSRVTAEAIRQAATKCFDYLGWGEPNPLVAGLAVGSRLVPKPETLQRWHAWMQEQLKIHQLGRRYTLDGLIEFHNTYALCTASMVSFGLAMRKGNPIRLNAAAVREFGLSIALTDKAVGEIRGDRPVPIAPTIADQIRFWLDHCRELDRRLLKLGFSQASHCRTRLRAILEGEDVPAFFTIGGRKTVKAASSHQIQSWWPAELGLEGNFGRHYWQNELYASGIASTAVDAFVRHSLRGTDPNASTAIRVPGLWMAQISSAIEQVLSRLGLTAFRGLIWRE